MSGTDQVDAVVIGSGPNGLSAAIRLARSGRCVVVCEAEDQAGGAVKSSELVEAGYVSDRFSAVYPASVASPVFAGMPLERHGLQWVHPEAAMAHPMPDGQAGVLYRDLDRTAAHLDDLHAGDGAAWKAWAKPWLGAFPALRDTMLSGFPPTTGMVRLLAARKISGMLDFARLLLMPASNLADELFTGPQARAWLFGSALHSDVPAEGSGSAIAGAYLHLLGHAVGWPSPKGGASTLTDSLVGYLQELGGEVRLATPVERVVARDGRTVGVVTAGGDRLRTPLVVATCTPHGLLDLTGPAMPTSYASKLAKFRYGPRTLKVDWTLDGPTPWTAPQARTAGTVHVGGEAEAVTAQTGAVARGVVPERPFLLFGQQTVADPSRAPAGKHTAWAYTRVPAQVTGPQEVLEHVDRMTEQVERFAPGFRDLIRNRYVQGPTDLESGDRNLVGGDVGGGSYVLHQTVFRPIPTLVPYATPIRGLWQGSSSTFPGGAVHGVPGWAAAGYALAAARVRR